MYEFNLLHHFFLDIFKFVYNIPKLLQTIASLYPNKFCQRDDKFKQSYTIHEKTRHKIWKNLPLQIWRYWVTSNWKWKIFFRILCPSQNVQTLHILALKVSKFRKQIMVSKLLPKNKPNSLSWKITTSRLIQKESLCSFCKKIDSLLY